MNQEGYRTENILVDQLNFSSTCIVCEQRRSNLRKRKTKPYLDPVQRAPNPSQSFAFASNDSFLANSRKSFLKILPDGLLGIASKNTTPPLNLL